jgi:hypothetical protein
MASWAEITLEEYVFCQSMVASAARFKQTIFIPNYAIQRERNNFIDNDSGLNIVYLVAV